MKNVILTSIVSVSVALFVSACGGGGGGGNGGGAAANNGGAPSSSNQGFYVKSTTVTPAGQLLDINGGWEVRFEMNKAIDAESVMHGTGLDTDNVQFFLTENSNNTVPSASDIGHPINVTVSGTSLRVSNGSVRLEPGASYVLRLTSDLLADDGTSLRTESSTTRIFTAEIPDLRLAECTMDSLNLNSGRPREALPSSILAMVETYDDLYGRRFRTNYETYESQYRSDTMDSPWGVFYTLRSLAKMYMNTRDQNYLCATLLLGELINEYRDDRHGRSDEVRGEIKKAWGSRRYYEDNLRTTWAVHTGLYAYPIFLVNKVVQDQFNENPNSMTVFSTRFLNLAFDMGQALDDFNDEYRTGYYYFPRSYESRYGAIARNEQQLPHNMNAAMGIALLYRGLSEGDASEQRAEQMARHFISHLRDPSNNNSYYEWNYHDAGNSRRIEDTSHGSISMAFMAAMFENGLIGDQQHIATGLANTFVNRIYKPARVHLAQYINGTYLHNHRFVSNPPADYTDRSSNLCHGWVELSLYNNQVATICERLIREEGHYRNSSLAELIKVKLTR